MTPVAMALLLGASLFGDDFESGTLLVSEMPPGQWDVMDLAPMTAIVADPTAAHRGSVGFKVVDNYADAGPGEGGNIRKTIPMTTSAYARVWMKMNGTSSVVGDIEPITLRETSSNQDLATLQVFPDGGIQLSGWDQSGYTFTPVAGLVDGGWQLIELAALNVGTNNGQRRVWIDGRPAAMATEKWNGRIVDHFVLGGTWENDSRWTGTVAFDDVRITDVPPASTLLVTFVDGGAPGDCLGGEISVLDSDGTMAVFPYAADPGIQVTGPAIGPLDSTCSMASPPLLAVGNLLRAVYVRALAPGVVTVTTSHPDFINVSSTLFINGDGGFDAGLTADAGPEDGGVSDAGGMTDGGEGDAGTSDGGGSTDGGAIDAGASPDAGGASIPSVDNVACGCSAGEGALLWLALSWVLARARRRVSRDSR
jgi:hypothetical protein